MFLLLLIMDHHHDHTKHAKAPNLPNGILVGIHQTTTKGPSHEYPLANREQGGGLGCSGTLAIYKESPTTHQTNSFPLAPTWKTLGAPGERPEMQIITIPVAFVILFAVAGGIITIMETAVEL